MIDILDLSGWALIGKKADGFVEAFAAEYLHEPRACTKCGGTRLCRHGTKKTTYADAPRRGFSAKLEATVRRYRCRDCGETFLQPLGGVLDERRMTERCAAREAGTAAGEEAPGCRAQLCHQALRPEFRPSNICAYLRLRSEIEAPQR